MGIFYRFWVPLNQTNMDFGVSSRAWSFVGLKIQELSTKILLA
jgi:hypothetical protein